MMRELREMTFEPGQFLGDVGAIGKKCDLLEQAFVVGWQSRPAFLDRSSSAARYFSPHRDAVRGLP